MNTTEKAQLTASICHIERFSKLEIPIYNSEVPDVGGRKTTTTRIRLQLKCLRSKLANCIRKIQNHKITWLTSHMTLSNGASRTTLTSLVTIGIVINEI